MVVQECVRKLVTGAMVKPVGYDVHSVHTVVIINKPRSEYLIRIWTLMKIT